MSIRAVKLALVGVAAACATTAYAHSGGPSPGYTGAPGEFTCRQCHSTFPLDDGVGRVTIEGAPAVYDPGDTYTLTIRVERPDRARWGFQLTALTGALDAAGTFALSEPSKTQLRTDDGKTYVSHRTAGTYAGTRGGASWTVRWTAPPAGTGVVDFYAAANAANNNNADTGDNIYTTFTESAEAEVVAPFVDVSAASGLASARGGSAVAWSDADGDGDLDFVVVDGASLRLFRNAAGTFETTEIEGASAARTAAWGDADGDARPDLLLATGTGVRLFRNTEAGFVDATADVGLAETGPASTAAWVDVDGDGALDCFVGSDAGAKVLRNDGGAFVDVTAAVGLEGLAGPRAASWADEDGDGRADVFVSTDDGARLLRQTGGGTFEDVTEAIGLGALGGATDAVWADADGDGRLDLVVATSSGVRLFGREGDGFVDATASRGLAGVAATSIAADDFDGDGRLDLIASTPGAVRLLHATAVGFADETAETGVMSVSGGVATWADADGDGHVDILAVSASRVELLRNPATTPALTVRAVTTSGADVVGATVSFGEQVRWLSGGGSAAQAPARAVFATSSIASAPARAVFPGGAGRERTATTGDGARLTLERPDDAPRVTAVAVASKNGVEKLNVDGDGLATSVTVVEVDGARMDATKYPKKRRNPDGTSSRISGTDVDFDRLVPRGRRVAVTVFDPSTGVRSAPFPFVRP